MTRLRKAGSIAWVVLLGLIGCRAGGEDSKLVVATAWPGSVREDLATAFARESGAVAVSAIEWVALDPDRSPLPALDRRGGVDLVLGGSLENHDAMARSGRIVAIEPTDPNPWRLASSPESVKVEGVSIVKDARHPVQARQFLGLLDRRGWVKPASTEALLAARKEGLRADLDQARRFDAQDEYRLAVAALDRFGHPPLAEAALQQKPPWPPASIARLQSDPNGSELVETLIDQLSPDPSARLWLQASWSKPTRLVDDALLAELAQADEGRLAREPRFRAWLRGEWTAWTRQLYRRVARVAGGYVPS